MPAPTYTPLPPAPTRKVPATFADLGDAFVAALPTFGSQLNALAVFSGAAADAAAASEVTATNSKNTAVGAAASAAASAASALTAPGTSATSTTSLTIGTGAKALTIQTGKAYAVGQFVTVAATASPTNYMLGQITAHDAGTGALTVQVGSVGGAGTFAAWTVALTAPGFNGDMSGALNEASPATLASAATVDVGAAAANTVNITGTTTITSLGTKAAGAVRRLVFAASLTLTHNPASLILPGGANITTGAGDVAEVVSLGGGNWRCLTYTSARGRNGLTPVYVATTTYTAAAGQEVYLMAAGASTVTGPASLTPGDTWAVAVCNGRVDNVVNWAGAKHEGIADSTMALNAPWMSLTFKYTGASYGYKIF